MYDKLIEKFEAEKGLFLYYPEVRRFLLRNMSREDVSFTFLHRVDEVEFNIEDGRWQSALALALTLPDICGGIAFPEIVKRYRDGRVILDRQKNPSRDVGTQYIRWFDEYAGKFFKVSPRDPSPYISGERCWQLRCEYLHQNKGFLNDEEEEGTCFHLGVNCGTSLCQLDSSSRQDGVTDIRIDIEQFCRRMCQAARSYYHSVYQEKKFQLYNTPVLDFIESGQRKKADFLVVILCRDEEYGRGLYQAVNRIPVHIQVFSSVEEMKKRTGNRKPSLWIADEFSWEKLKKTGFQKLEVPAILLTKKTKKEEYSVSDGTGLTVLSMPVHPDELRRAVSENLPKGGK